MRYFLKALIIGIFPISSALAATGSHIQCDVHGIQTIGSASPVEMQRTVSLFLDDVNGKVQSEIPDISATTTSYSDAKIEFFLRDVDFVNLTVPTVFGIPVKETPLFVIDRIKGTFSGVTVFFNGTEFDSGLCHIIKGPVAKF